MVVWITAKVNCKKLFAMEETQASWSSLYRILFQECEGFFVPFSARSVQTFMSTYFIVLAKPLLKTIENWMIKNLKAKKPC